MIDSISLVSCVDELDQLPIRSGVATGVANEFSGVAPATPGHPPESPLPAGAVTQDTQEKNVEYTLKKVQEALTLVVDWGRKSDFRFSIEKTKVMFFTR